MDGWKTFSFPIGSNGLFSWAKWLLVSVRVDVIWVSSPFSVIVTEKHHHWFRNPVILFPFNHSLLLVPGTPTLPKLSCDLSNISSSFSISVLKFPSLPPPQTTADGSEIPFPTTVWMLIKPCKYCNGIVTTFPSTGEFTGFLNEPSTVSHHPTSPGCPFFPAFPAFFGGTSQRRCRTRRAVSSWASAHSESIVTADQQRMRSGLEGCLDGGFIKV